MTRLIGPDESCRLVYLPDGTARAQSAQAHLFADSGGSTPADVLTVGGDPISGGLVTVDAYSKIPLVQFPDGVDTIYASVNAGPIVPLYARVDDRLDSLASGLAASTSAASTALTAHNAATTSVHGVANTALLETTSGAQTKADAAQLAASMVGAVRKRPAWRRASTSFQFQSGHGWTVTGAGSSNLNDTSTFVRGTQCASMVSNGAGGQANLRATGLSAMDLTGKSIRVIFKVVGAAHVSSVNFFVGTSTLTNTFKWRLNPTTASSKLITEGQWVTLTFGWADLNAASGSYSITSGVPSTKTGFTDLLFQVIDDSGGTVTTYVQAVEFFDDTTTTFPNGLVSITFDDTDQTVWDYARPKMDALGFAGTNYAIIDSLGTAGKFTLAELQALQNHSGWEVGVHSYAAAVHTNRYPSYTAAQVAADFSAARIWMAQNGFRGDSLAYPGGNFEQTTDSVWVDQIAARYFTSARSILWTSAYIGENFPPPMPHRLRAMSSISSTQVGNNNPTTLVAAGGPLDRIASQGGWLILVFHKITTGAASVATECSQADFNTVMDGLASRGITVLPVGDALTYYS